MPIIFVEPVIDKSVRLLCLRPYPGHKKGCPNFGKRDICPPNCPLIDEVFDLSKPVVAVWTSFNLESHRERMKSKHPNWSRRQLDCCLYWQGGVNKNLRRNVEYNLERYIFFNGEKNLIATYIPEAMGVNVTETMKNVGVILEWPPEKIVNKVAFVGVKLTGGGN